MKYTLLIIISVIALQCFSQDNSDVIEKSINSIIKDINSKKYPDEDVKIYIDFKFQFKNSDNTIYTVLSNNLYHLLDKKKTNYVIRVIIMNERVNFIIFKVFKKRKKMHFINTGQGFSINLSCKEW